MKLPIRLTLLFLFACCLIQCDEIPSPVCNSGALIKTEMNREGRVTFDQQLNAFVVVSAVEGTIDSQDFGIPCGLPDEMKIQDLQVIFNGKYYGYEGDAEPLLGGQIYYNLQLLKITRK